LFVSERERGGSRFVFSRCRRVYERLELFWSLSDRFEFCHKRGLDTHEHAGDFKEW
jgi:hypothetical protein